MNSQSNIAKVSAPSKAKKTRFQVLGWLFGKPLETFDNLLPIRLPVATTSTASTSGSNISASDLKMPTEQNVMQHFIHLYDERRDSYRLPELQNSIIWNVADNLIAFWELFSPSSELR